MAREYKVVPPDGGTIVRVYNEPGVSWRDAKKQLRQYYLDMASGVRSLREKDAVPDIVEDMNDVVLADAEGEVLQQL